MTPQGEDAGDPVRVVLADRHPLFREVVRSVFEAKGDLSIVAEASDGLDTLAAARDLQPDVIVVDARLGDPDALEVVRLVKARVPECAVVVLDETADPAVLTDALEAGADGYASKDSPLAELIEATRAVCRGETVIPKHLLGPVLQGLLRRRASEDDAIVRAAQLSPREKEVLLLLADGADKDSIAATLIISTQTARTHIQNILVKLGVHSRLEAVAFVRTHSLFEYLRAASRAAPAPSPTSVRV